MIAIRIAAVVLLLAAAPKPAETVIERANALVAKRRFAEAEELVRAAMKQNPAAHGYHLALGRVLAAKGQPSAAYAELVYEYMRAGAAPEGKDALLEANDVLGRTRGLEGNDARFMRQATVTANSDGEEALRELDKISKDLQSHYVVRFFRAEAQLRDGEFEIALKEFRALSLEDPWFVPAVVQEAMTLRVMKRQGDAEAVAAKARKIAPDHWALKSLDLLAQPLPSPALTPKQR